MQLSEADNARQSKSLKAHCLHALAPPGSGDALGASSAALGDLRAYSSWKAQPRLQSVLLGPTGRVTATTSHVPDHPAGVSGFFMLPMPSSNSAASVCHASLYEHRLLCIGHVLPIVLVGVSTMQKCSTLQRKISFRPSKHMHALFHPRSCTCNCACATTEAWSPVL